MKAGFKVVRRQQSAQELAMDGDRSRKPWRWSIVLNSTGNEVRPSSGCFLATNFADLCRVGAFGY